MQVLSNTIKDEDVLSIIRKFLVSGVMVNGVLMYILEGTLLALITITFYKLQFIHMIQLSKIN